MAGGVASDKSLTKALLEVAGVPVPQGTVARSVPDALAAAENRDPHEGEGHER